MAAVSLRDEVTGLLQRLVRLDTVNPPGNETRAAELLRDYLVPRGVACALYARTPERANLVARIAGRDPDAPRLLLLTHTDTVVADPSEWALDPWSGELRDGEVWGRGALDMKGQVAAAAVAMAFLADEGFRPEGDLIFAATADEEVGRHYGLSWLCDEHPEAVRSTWCVNEGGGDRVVIGGRVLYLCSTSERAASAFVIRVHGKGGHASMPALGVNALVRAAPLVERLADIDLPVRLLPETSAFLELVLGDVPRADEALERLQAVSPRSVAMVGPMLRTTIAPTVIRASERLNVIPARCEIECDCRLLPGEDAADVERAVRTALGDGDYDFEWLGPVVGGTRSSLDTPLWETIAGYLAHEEPDAVLAPILMPGFTDSHYLRESFGTIAYGFFPMRTMSPEVAAAVVHSADERASVEDLELGTEFLVHVARELLA